MNYSQTSFLDEIVTPYFWGSIQNNICSVIYDLEGKIFLCTNKFAQMLGCENWQDLKGQTIYEYSLKMAHEDPDFFKNLENIRKIVVNKKVNVQYVNFVSNKQNIISQMVYHFPIFMPNGEVAGTRVIANDFDVIDSAVNKFTEYLKKNKKQVVAKDDNPFQHVHLTDKEYAILFLLGANLSIDDIAFFLDIPVTKIINVLEGPICQKFGLNMLDIQLLRQLALDGNIISKFPKKFMKSRSIILKHPEIDIDALINNVSN